MLELESLGVSRVAEPYFTPSDALKESSSAVPSHSPATSPSHDEDISVLPPPADATVSSALPLPHPETCGDLGAPTVRNDKPSTRESQPCHESSPMDVSVTIARVTNNCAPLLRRNVEDLPHELQDRVNTLPSSYGNSAQARVLFEAMIDEAMDDDLNAPPISVINDVTDEDVVWRRRSAARHKEFEELRLRWAMRPQVEDM
ncbi:hypothetical protein M405DRAFT_932659 [Rhizopogon salebrosus TDB-379]|nr:hypothetical protein M405DRAFT_932659 [Rhizopogon salebrosus TDB-379]